jgi:MurE/MurF fusion protein
MLLGNLIKSASKSYKKIPIKGISFDSRKIKRKDIFFAIKGKKNSGIRFINDAIRKGASAIVSDEKVKKKDLEIPFILVRDVRKSLTEACSNLYKEKPKNIIAVTGTNGKSSVADFFSQILNLNKVPVASIGTLGIFSKNYIKKTNLTSLDPLSLHKSLHILSKKKINNVILEASSHGLHQKRLDNLNIKTGIFTNLSHDHLDYHKNMNSYLNSKMYLFNNLLRKNSNIITDEENKEFKEIKKISNKKSLKIKTIGTISGDIKILYNEYKKNNQIIRISYKSNIFLLTIPLIGFFQIKNLLMATIAASNCGINITKIFNQMHKIKPVPGRLECIANLKNNSNIIIDFAHTPDALEKSLVAIKKQYKKPITLVFGCGGERDKKKRSHMGKIAEKYCHRVFITDDNPRNENPKKIRSEIIKGCKKKVFNIGNRKKAIDTAIKGNEPNEVILVAGKGHERLQDYGSKIINFSDKNIIKDIISKRKFSFKKSSWSNFLANKVFNKNNVKMLNYSGVSINTKNIKKNDLFFAIRGKRIDGHKFAKKAILMGAIKSVISKKIKSLSKAKSIKVQNTLSSLTALAKVTRENSSARIIAITGSVGKTTLKNLISFTLKNYGKVYHSPHSYNNKFGVPLSLSNIKTNTDYGVFEIGMDKKGEINNLSKIVKPEISIITNISGAHFKNFNSLKDIAKAKSEIIDNTLPGGTVILNKDDSFFSFLLKKVKQKKLKVVSFSSNKKADISLIKIIKTGKIYKLKILVKSKVFHFYIKRYTDSIVPNILACISVLFILNLDLTYIKKKIINFLIPSGRGDISRIRKFKKVFNLIDESYNANPLSMKIAIKNMKYYKRTKNSKKIAFLGDMLELGNKSNNFHKELATSVNKSDVDKVFVYGKYIKKTFNLLSQNKKGKVFNNLKEANDYFDKILNNNDLLMVKGSNATGLNQFTKNIKKGQISAV